MGMPCKSCTHDRREELDAGIVAGRSLESLSREFGINSKAIGRHRPHVSAAIRKVGERKRRQERRTAMERLERLATRLEELLDQAEQERSRVGALNAAKELRETLKLLATAAGELKGDGATVQVLNVQTSPEWLALRGAILAALRPHPEALAAVVEAIRPLEGAGVPRIASGDARGAS